MSAVCGIFNIDGNMVSEEKASKMMEKLNIYSFNDTGTYLNNEIFLGCGIQYITKESQKEILPVYSKYKGLAVTADAIIDNRQELFSIFDVSEEEAKHIADSKLILMSYEKWGHDCPKHLVGDFAFAIWDEENNELFCARDHVGARTFYYYYSENVFSFCTVMKPLLTHNSNSTDLNERWITDFLALDGIQHEFECNETIYKDIFQLPPSCSMVVSSNSIRINKYWNPIKDIKPLRLDTDEEYEEAFRKVLGEAVNCRLRSINEVGIMLSGGLDSSSIACMAAKTLSKYNKRLKGFSSIPITEYKNNKSKYYVPDESEYIESIKTKAENIDVCYCRSDHKNSITNIDYFINIFEQPYKTVQTLYWYNELIEKAAQSGCNILLNGQFGNSTISDGEFMPYALALYKKLKFVTLFKEIKAFSNLKKIPKSRVCKVMFKATLPYKLRKLASEILDKNFDRFALVPVSTDLIKKWDVGKRFDEKSYNQHTRPVLDYYEEQEYVVDQLAFSHIGAIETKISLANGIVIRDPSKDKRVIEFCLSLPSEQFVRDGHERYLIRRAMKDILPDKIRLNTSTRGLQSADWIQRLEPVWEDVCNELEDMLGDEEIRPYINYDKLEKELIQLKNGLDEKKSDVIRMLLITLVFSKFIKSLNKGN